MRRVPHLPVRLWMLAALIAAILPLTLPRAATAKAPTPPALLAAPTTTTYVLKGTFTTTGQSMLGPGVATQAAITSELFNLSWDKSGSAGSVAHVSIDPCDPIPGVSCGINGDFGAEVSAFTNGQIGMSMTYHGATSGTINITYPVTVTLTVTTDYSATAPKTISIESSLSVDPGAQITSVAPTFDRFSLNGKFGFHAGVSGRICFFDCLDIPQDLPISIPTSIHIPSSSPPNSVATGEILSLTPSDFVSLPGFGLTSCFNFATNFLLGAGPYYGGDGHCGTNGYVAFPDPKLVTATGSNGALTATGVDPYVVIPISSIAWAARIASLPPGTPNFGPVNIGGFGFGYTTYNQIYSLVIRQLQTFTFNPLVDVSLQLPRSMAYVVRDTSNNIVTNTSGSTVTFLAGHKVVITLPKDQSLPVTITPSLSIRTAGNNFTNSTKSTLTVSVNDRVLELYLKHPGYNVSLDFGALGSIDVPIMPKINLNLGPLYEQTASLPPAEILPYTNSWNMGGFSPIALGAFQPPSILLSDNGIRGQTVVTAIAPSTVTSINCVDIRPGLSVRGTGLGTSAQRVLIYSGAGWHVITCTATTVSDGTFIGTFGIYVLSDPHRAAQAPPPPLDFGTPVGACNPRGFLLKNDTSKTFNLNSLTLSGSNADDWFIVSGGDTNQLGAMPSGYGQVLALQFCKSGDGPRNATLTVRGSLGTGGGAPAPVYIPMVANGANLTITKSQTTATPVTNQNIVYTLTARASGGAASGVLVRDTLPAGTQYISVSNDAGFSCAATGQVVECTGDLAANAAVVITITARVTAGSGTMLTNTAVVDPNDAIAETTEIDNTASTTATVTTAPNLTISKSQSTASPATGSQMTYTLTATSGGGASSNVKVRDTLPAGTQYVSVTGMAGSGFACQFINTGTGVVECTGNLAANASVTITITVKVTGAIGATLNNTAAVDPDNLVTETNETDNTSNQVTATIVNGLNLSLTMTQDNAAPVPDANLVYTVKVKATGGVANNVLVRDTLPATGVQLVSVTNDANFVCPLPQPATPNIVDCTGNLAAEQEVTITITVRVTAPGGTTLTNVAEVDPLHTIPETNETATDDSATVVANVPTPLNLTISKTANVSSAPHGSTVVYTIVATANGGAANNIIVRDQLPANFTFVSVSRTLSPNPLPSTIFTCSNPDSATPGLVNCVGNLGQGESVTITLTATVDPSAAPGVTGNTAIVDPPTATLPRGGVIENNENDNSATANVTVTTVP